MSEPAVPLVLSRIRIIESYSTEGGHSAHQVCPDHNPTQALSPQSHTYTPLIPLTYTSRDTMDNLAWPINLTHTSLGGNRRTRRKPTQTRGECANSTQTVTQAGNRTRVPGAVKQQCEPLCHRAARPFTIATTLFVIISRVKLTCLMTA